MADNKTKPTDASVADYIASRANAQQRTDCRALMALFRKVTRHSPTMWGPSIEAKVRFQAPDAPNDRLTPGARFRWYEGVVAVAVVEVLARELRAW